jgi:hypothetical protein
MYSIQFPAANQVQGYGLGLVKAPGYGDVVFTHGGGGFGFLSHMSWYPQFGIGIVVLTNSTDHSLTGGFPGQVVDRVLRAAMAEVPKDDQPFEHLAPVEIGIDEKRRLAGEYFGRGFGVEIEVEDGGQATARVGNQSMPLRFLGTEEAFADTPEGRTRVRFSLDAEGRPVYLEMVNNGQSADYNGGPYDPPGPDKAEWTRHEGEYTYTVWGQRTASNELYRQDGYLYFGRLRLQEHLPGLFFSSTGEALDLRGPLLTWRNIRLTKVR